MRVLCQDCLRVFEVTDEEYEKHNYGQGMCVCGGEVCHCHLCMQTAEVLEDWSKEKNLSPMLIFPISSWSAENGCVLMEIMSDD